ncbi:MAG: hypothetical protein ACI906_005199 [Candidatus Latescibacterota bacterium]|jgi:hypothetical protein
MRSLLFYLTLGSVTAFISPRTATAQLEHNALVEAIALYPQAIQRAALDASQHPQFVADMAALQEQASHQLNTLLSAHPRRKQASIWALARHPELLAALVEEQIVDRREIRELVTDYPRDTRRAALLYAPREGSLLASVHAINETSEAEFAHMIKAQSAELQDLATILVSYSDIWGQLAYDTSQTSALARTYSQDPKAIEKQLASLHTEQNRDAPNEGYEKTAERSPSSARYDYDERRLAEQNENDLHINDYPNYPPPYAYWYAPRWYAPPNFYASIGWRLSPRLHTSIAWSQRTRVYRSNRSNRHSNRPYHPQRRVGNTPHRRGNRHHR